MAQTQDLAPTRLADQLERGFRGGAWHGPALMELLAGLGVEGARWRPAPASHSIADLVGHLTYWLEDTHRQISGAPRPSVGAEADWAAGAPASEADWQAACAALEAAHAGLRAAVLDLAEGRLDEARSGSDTTIRGLLQGTLQHNAYHAGQIALLRKLAEGGGRP